MGKVNTKLEVFTVSDPMPLAHPEGDPWKDFREVEKVRLEWTLTYNHSLGKYSKFFLGLEEGKFYATQCPKCGKVWAIPRPVCADCLTICRWKELPGTGVLETFSVSEFVPSFMKVEIPYVLVMVRMDGAPDTLFTHELKNYGKREDIKVGMKVKVVYNDGPVEHPIKLMHFEPLQEGRMK